jgi:F-box interacting protein
LENQGNGKFCCSFSFGYDHFTHTYKIVAVSYFYKKKKNQVNVYTLGSNSSWRRIQDLISNIEVCPSNSTPGVFASGTINWSTRDAKGRHIVSLDLEKESYRKITKPNMEANGWSLGVSRDCLCIFASTERFVDVWILKEYENEESWTKLYRVPHWRDLDIGFRYDEALYISEDDQLLMYCKNWLLLKFAVYDSKKDTFITPKLPTIGRFLLPQVYVESLISPCS